MKKAIFTLSSVVLLLAACHKSDNKTTAQKVQAKWSLVSDQETNTYTGSAPQSFSYTGTSSDYFDFRSDGKLYISENGSQDTVPYKIVNDQYLVTNGTDSSQIKTLTDNSLVLYLKQVGPTETYEDLTTLKK